MKISTLCPSWFRIGLLILILALSASAHALQDTLVFVRSPDKVSSISFGALGTNLSAFSNKSQITLSSSNVELSPNWGDTLWLLGDAISNINTPEQGWKEIHLIRAKNLTTLICDKNQLDILNLSGLGNKLVTLTCKNNYLHPDQLPNELENTFTTYEYSPQKPLPLKNHYWLFEPINLSRYHHFSVSGTDYYSSIIIKYADDKTPLPSDYYTYENGHLEIIKCPLNNRSIFIEFKLPRDLWSGFQLDPWYSTGFLIDSLPQLCMFRSDKEPGSDMDACIGMDSEIPLSYSLGTDNRIIVEKTTPLDNTICWSGFVAGNPDTDYRIHALKANSLSMDQMELTQLTFITSLENLSTLKLNLNRLAQLSLSECHALSYLNCSQNNLSDLILPNDAPISVLKVIDAQQNALQSITLDNLTAIDTLRLDNNRLPHISCKDAGNLRFFSLENNALVNVYNQAFVLDFSNNTHLLYLNLANNRLDSLPKGIQAATNLSHLDLSQNRFALDKLPLPKSQWSHYIYAPQQPWPNKGYYSSSDLIDLSRFNEIKADNGSKVASSFVVKTQSGKTLQLGVDYSLNQGRITIYSPQEDSCYIEVHNALFPQFTGPAAFRTQNFKMLYLPNVVTLTTSKALNTPALLELSVSELPCVMKVDWGNGVLKDYHFAVGSKMDSTLVGIKLGDSLRIYSAHLKRLKVDNRQMLRLRVAQADKLETLYINDNLLQTLNITGAPKLKVLNMSNNQILAVDLNLMPNLDSLNVQRNRLSQINLQNQARLRYLFCGDNELSVLNLSSNLDLEVLNCSSNKLSTLDLKSHSKLRDVFCFSNPNLNQLSIQGSLVLREVNCTTCELDSIPLAIGTSLEVLRCANNKLKALDLSSCNKLRLVFANNNQLRSFKIPNKAIDSVNVRVNSLNISTLPIPRPDLKYYSYESQSAISIANRINKIDAIDLSAFASIEDYDGIRHDSKFLWVKPANPSDSLKINIDYTNNNGVFRFIKSQKETLECRVSSPAFPKLVALKTTFLMSVFDSVSDFKSVCLGQALKCWYMSDSLRPSSVGDSIRQNPIEKSDSSIYLFLTVYPKFTNIPVSLQTCTNELPYTFANMHLEETGIYNIALKTVQGCDSSIRLTFSVNPCDTIRDTIYTWENRSPLQHKGHILRFRAVDTLFTFSYTSSTGCDSTLLVSVYALPAVEPIAKLIGDTSICEGQESSLQLTISGTPPFTYRLNGDANDRRSMDSIVYIKEVRTQTQKRYLTLLRDTVMAATTNSMADTARITVNPIPKVQWRIPTQICDNEGAVELSYTIVQGKADFARLIFGEKGHRLGYADSLISLNNTVKKLRFPIDNRGAGKDIGLHVQIYDSIACYNTADSLTFEVRLGQVIRKKWNDMLVCDNLQQRFQGYQWYCDRYLIDGATKQFYWDQTGLNGIYHVVVQDTNMDFIESCPLGARPGLLATSSPNPAKIGQEIHVFHGYDAEMVDKAVVYDLSGQRIACLIDSDSYPMRITGIRTGGVYVVHLRIEGLTQAVQVKIIVI